MEEFQQEIFSPGDSINITFDEMGFYRLYDPDYTWMDITGYIFPDTSNFIRKVKICY